MTQLRFLLRRSNLYALLFASSPPMDSVLKLWNPVVCPSASISGENPYIELQSSIIDITAH